VNAGALAGPWNLTGRIRAHTFRRMLHATRYARAARRGTPVGEPLPRSRRSRGSWWGARGLPTEHEDPMTAGIPCKRNSNNALLEPRTSTSEKAMHPCEYEESFKAQTLLTDLGDMNRLTKSR